MRTLAIAALSCAAAVFAAVYWLPLAWLPALALPLAALGALLFARRRLWLRGFALSLCALGFGFGFFWLYSRCTVVPASALEGAELTICAQLTDYPETEPSYTRAEVRLHTEGLPALKALLYENDGDTLSRAKPGDWVSCTVKLRAADRLYGESYRGYQSRGIYLIARTSGELGLREGEVLRFWPVRVNHALCALIERVFPADASLLLRALMLGDKEELYRDDALHLALSRAGLMHTVAVSGMHVAFLVGLLQTVLGRGRRSTLFCLGMTWVYVLITGAAPSAVRAGVMQSLLLIAPLVLRENDPLTSLSAALAVLLLHNPHAIANVGLQFSFASMAGILCFSETFCDAVYERFPALRESGLGRAAVGTAVNSLSVLPFTVPLMALYFGQVPLFSLVSNLLVFGLVVLCFYGGYLCCALGLVWLPAARAGAWLLSWPVRGIMLTARLISAVPFAAVYTEHRLMLVWLAFAYALFFACFLLRGSALRRFGIPALLAALSLALIWFGLRYSYEYGADTVAALDIGQGQCLVVMSGRETLMIDCGGIGTVDNAGETAGAYLLSRGRRRVDVLLLTHTDEDHMNGAAQLMRLCPVRTLLLAEELDAAEPDEAALLEAAAECGAEICLLNGDSLVELGSIRARLYPPVEGAKGNDRCLAAVVSLGSFDMLVTGDLSAKGERALLERAELGQAELLIAGHHGSKSSSCDELLDALSPGTVLVSCGYNTYGHPAAATLERLAAHGCTVYRTDENGTIEIRIER